MNGNEQLSNIGDGRRKLYTHDAGHRMMQGVPQSKPHSEMLDTEQMPGDVPKEKRGDGHRAQVEDLDTQARLGDFL